MKTYLVTITPLEPYFFGNEKTFIFPGNEGSSPLANRYFIKSEPVPSQSTILGALRYLFLPVKKNDWNYSAEEKKLNAEAVGGMSFTPEENRTFGKIKKISPIFITDGNSDFVPTPFDHIEGNNIYTPFSQYRAINTPDGERYFTPDYDVKNGISESYMNLNDGSIISANEIFKGELRTGISRSLQNKSLFKKEYCILNTKYSFAVYLDLDDDIEPSDEVLFLGQGKSAFSFKFALQENTLNKKIKTFLSDNVVYCLSDAFIPQKVYEISKFAITKTKTYRAYTKEKTKVTKSAILYRTITAGSIFIPTNKNEFFEFVSNQTTNRIGYNEFITK